MWCLVFGGCEKLVEGVYDGSSEVAETFCGCEACEGRAVDGAGVSGRFWRGIVGADDGGGLLEKTGAEVPREVVGDVDVRNYCCLGGLSAGEEKEAGCCWGVCGEGQSELVGVCGELSWDDQGVGVDLFVVEFSVRRIFGDRHNCRCVHARR